MTGADERDAARERLLFAALPHVAFDGWSAKAMAAGAADAGLGEAAAERYFPGGPAELVEAFSRWADGEMARELVRHDLDAMPLHDRVALAVRARIEATAPWREAVRRGLAFLALPGNAPLGVKCLIRTVDRVWYAAGDRSADFSYYTKRALLSAVYSATALYWLDDRSEGAVDTWAFLDRRMADVMRIHALRSRAERFARTMPNPFRPTAPGDGRPR